MDSGRTPQRIGGHLALENLALRHQVAVYKVSPDSEAVHLRERLLVEPREDGPLPAVPAQDNGHPAP